MVMCITDEARRTNVEYGGGTVRSHKNDNSSSAANLCDNSDSSVTKTSLVVSSILWLIIAVGKYPVPQVNISQMTRLV